MATDDCVEIGTGPCPCEGGQISVERCAPDHPWAKPHQSYYRAGINCPECKAKYEFFSSSPNENPRLVESKDAEALRQRKRDWHEALRAIEQDLDFQALGLKLQEHLVASRSAAAKYRLLRAAGLTSGLSLEQYRRRGFELSPTQVEKTLSFLGVQLPNLSSKVAEAHALTHDWSAKPPAIATGITGLEA
jgi:hypothetical protein